MVNLYFHTNDPSKRKAVQWFAKHDIALTQRNIEKELLSAAEIQQLLTISLNGTDDLVSQRSRETKALKIDPDQMTLNELTAAIQKSPHILKNPIIFSENKLLRQRKNGTLYLQTAAAHRVKTTSTKFRHAKSAG